MDDIQEKRRSSGRVLRFSLRTLLVSMTLMAVWLAYVSNKAREQRAAVARIRELQGSVTYDFQNEARRTGVKAVPPGWPWLRRLVGDEYFQQVERVSLSGPLVADADMQLIGSLTRLRYLGLRNTAVGDEGLRYLQKLGRLDFLSLMETKVTSQGLAHLKGMRQLTQLILSDCPGVDSAGLPAIGDLSHLAFLNLDRTQVASSGLVELTRLKGLTHLYLDRTPVDDAAVPILSQIKTLKELSLGVTLISTEGINKIHADLPTCVIVWGDPSQPMRL